MTNYQEKLEINKKKNIKDLILELRKEGITRGPNSKKKKLYESITNLSLLDLAKVLTEIQEKKENKQLNKIDRLSVENWGNKDIFVKYIMDNNLYIGYKTNLIKLKMDELRNIVLKKHGCLSPKLKSSPKQKLSPTRILSPKPKTPTRRISPKPTTPTRRISPKPTTPTRRISPKPKLNKKSGMISCNKCGSLILKIKLKKHQESSKCKKIASSPQSVGTPQRRRRRTKIIDESDEDELSPVESIGTPPRRQRKRTKMIESDEEDEFPRTPGYDTTSPIQQTPISYPSTPKSDSYPRTPGYDSTIAIPRTPGYSPTSPIQQTPGYGYDSPRTSGYNSPQTPGYDSPQKIEYISDWYSLIFKLSDENLIKNSNISNESFKDYEMIQKMIFDNFCNHYGNIVNDDSNFNLDENGFINCLKMYKCNDDIKNPLSFDNNDELIVTSIDDKFLIFISVKDKYIKYYFDVTNNFLQMLDKNTFDFSLTNINTNKIDEILNKNDKTIFDYFMLLFSNKMNILQKPALTILKFFNKYLDSQILSFPKIHLIHFLLNRKIFIVDSVNLILDNSNKLILDFTNLKKDKDLFSFLNEEESQDEEESEEAEEEEDEEEAEEEEDEEEAEEEYVRKDEDDYISEKSFLEEGDEIIESEGIDNVDDINLKLNEINNKVIKNDKIIRDVILKHLGLA